MEQPQSPPHKPSPARLAAAKKRILEISKRLAAVASEMDEIARLIDRSQKDYEDFQENGDTDDQTQ